MYFKENGKHSGYCRTVQFPFLIRKKEKVVLVELEHLSHRFYNEFILLNCFLVSAGIAMFVSSLLFRIICAT